MAHRPRRYKTLVGYPITCASPFHPPPLRPGYKDDNFRFQLLSFMNELCWDEAHNKMLAWFVNKIVCRVQQRS